MRFAVSAIALIVSAGLAGAADLGGPSYDGSLKDDYVAPVSHRWAGFYIGGNVGYAWGDIKFSDGQGSRQIFRGSILRTAENLKRTETILR